MILIARLGIFIRGAGPALTRHATRSAIAQQSDAAGPGGKGIGWNPRGARWVRGSQPATLQNKRDPSKIFQNTKSVDGQRKLWNNDNGAVIVAATSGLLDRPGPSLAKKSLRAGFVLGEGIGRSTEIEGEGEGKSEWHACYPTLDRCV